MSIKTKLVLGIAGVVLVAGAGVLGYWWVTQGNQLLKPQIETADIPLGTSENVYTPSVGFESRIPGWQVTLTPDVQTWFGAAVERLGYVKPVTFMTDTEDNTGVVRPDTLKIVFAPLEKLTTQERQQLLFPLYGGPEKVLVVGIGNTWDGPVLVYMIYLDSMLLGNDPEVIAQNWTYQTFRLLAAANPAKVQPALIENLWGGMVAGGVWPIAVSKR